MPFAEQTLLGGALNVYSICLHFPPPFRNDLASVPFVSEFIFCVKTTFRNT